MSNHITTQTEPRWEIVPGHPHLRVSDDGQVQSCLVLRGLGVGSGKGARLRALGETWKPLTPQTLPSGYQLVQESFRENGKVRRRSLYIHRLVLLAFVGPCPPGCECLHHDGNRSNNRLPNLRWGTKKENAEDMERHGRRPRGSRHGIAKLNESKVAEPLSRNPCHPGTVSLCAVCFPAEPAASDTGYAGVPSTAIVPE